MRKLKSFDTWPPEKQAAWREKKREHDRKWREANPEKTREHHRKWREANREKNRERARKRYNANREKFIEAALKWREANLEKAREASRKWRESYRQQYAADKFFILAGAAEQISQTITEKQNENNTKPKRNRSKN